MAFKTLAIGRSNLSEFGQLDEWFTEAENRWSAEFYANVAQRWWPLQAVALVVYLFICTGLRQWMSTRKPFKLDGMLIIWNVMFSVFSIFAAYRTFCITLQHWDIPSAVDHANSKFSDGPAPFWNFVWTISKVPQIFETMFLVLQKKKLTVLHCCHHASLVIFGWIGVVWASQSSALFISLSLFVHSFMYPYVLIRNLGLKIPTIIPVMLTTLQMVQIVMGLSIDFHALTMHATNTPCDMPFGIALIYSLRHTFIAVLFCQKFLVGRYFREASSAKKVA